MTEKRPRSEAEIVEFLRSIDVKAPDSLHRQIESMVAERRRPARRRRGGLPVRAFASTARNTSSTDIATPTSADLMR